MRIYCCFFFVNVTRVSVRDFCFFFFLRNSDDRSSKSIDDPYGMFHEYSPGDDRAAAMRNRAGGCRSMT